MKPVDICYSAGQWESFAVVFGLQKFGEYLLKSSFRAFSRPSVGKGLLRAQSHTRKDSALALLPHYDYLILYLQ